MNRHKIHTTNKPAARTSVYLLCLYLFGIIVSGVLHPFQHAHEHISGIEKVSLCSPFSCDNQELVIQQETHSHSTLEHSCPFCHIGIFNEFLIERFNYQTIKISCDYHFEEYSCNNYNDNQVSFKSSRAPPSLV